MGRINVTHSYSLSLCTHAVAPLVTGLRITAVAPYSITVAWDVRNTHWILVKHLRPTLQRMFYTLIVFCVGKSKAPPVLYSTCTTVFESTVLLSHKPYYIRGLAYALREWRPRRPFRRRSSTQTLTQTDAGRALCELLVLSSVLNVQNTGFTGRRLLNHTHIQ